MIVLVPVVNAVTTPVDAPIVATVVLLLVHVPPVTALVSAAVVPVQTTAGPVIGATGFTVTAIVA